jgi:hypothetical protein
MKQLNLLSFPMRHIVIKHLGTSFLAKSPENEIILLFELINRNRLIEVLKRIVAQFGIDLFV